MLAALGREWDHCLSRGNPHSGGASARIWEQVQAVNAFPCWVWIFFGLVFFQPYGWFLCTPRLKTQGADLSLGMKRKSILGNFPDGPALSLPLREFPLILQNSDQVSPVPGGYFWPLWAEFNSLLLELSLVVYNLPLLHALLPYQFAYFIWTNIVFISISQHQTGSTHSGCYMNEWVY